MHIKRKLKGNRSEEVHYQFFLKNSSEEVMLKIMEKRTITITNNMIT